MRGKFVYNFFFCVFFITLVFTLPYTLHAADLTSTNFIIRDPVIGGGGGYSSSATFQLFGSQDLTFTGYGESLNFIGEYGFLYFPAPSTPTPTPTPGGGGGGISYPGGICARIADFNCDSFVNLLDLSIFLYHSDRGTVNSRYDLNADNELGLKDISVMFYYWDN